MSSEKVGEIKLPVKAPYDTSLMLILYRWRDGYYSSGDVHNENDLVAVVEIINVINAMLAERNKNVRRSYGYG